MIIVVDNYDSFTYNLVQYIGELAQDFPFAQDLQVVRNDKITLEEITALNPDAIVISPGPGRPEDAGISMALIEKFTPTKPILGVCLGHQSIGQVFGGTITTADELMHGKTSEITHTGAGVFEKLDNPFTATRYHSLVVARDGLPDMLEVTAWAADSTIMGLRHRNHPLVQGVQFHPESILTNAGKQLLKNFLTQVQDSIAQS
ncbi:MAG: aminodeoxychorismate/anthranilate synthase component II [Cyanobacteria bacterium P01_F01_bin.42]